MSSESLKIVGIRFQNSGPIYDFDAGHFVLNCGDLVIVKTEQGTGLGKVVRGPQKVDRPSEGKEIKKDIPLGQRSRFGTAQENSGKGEGGLYLLFGANS